MDHDETTQLRHQVTQLEAERDCLLDVMHTAYRWAKTGVGTFYDALAELQHHAHHHNEHDDRVNIDALRTLQARYRNEMKAPPS